MTERLHHDDPLLLKFTAQVRAHGSWQGKPSLVLDRTAFYPESGGQMADRGTLGGLAVVDVQVGDDGVVHHLVDGALPAPGTDLAGEIDRVRRRVHMALHTGQHMLSRALVDMARGETVSSRLGENACTIDIDREKVDERDLARAEDLVNDVIESDVAVRQYFPEAGELASLPLRRALKVTENIRVVAIGDFDVSPCGGTHCLSSGQVGLVRITGVERYKGKIRLTFSSGRRARLELGAQADLLRALGRDLTCGDSEVPAAIAKLRRELSETRELLGQSRARLATLAAEELIAKAAGEPTVVASFDAVDADFLRVVAKRVTEAGLVALLAARGAEGQHVLAARPASSSFDCGALIKKAAAASGGRGGGRPEMAEGRLPPGADWQALARA
jgi:alanyl-tRNA synthetase